MVTKRTRKLRKLRKKADKLWKDLCFKKHGKECQSCRGKANQVHHFFPKSSYGALRYNLDNGIPICQGCHMKHHQKGDPLIHQKIIEVKGEDWYEKLLKEARKKDSSFKGIKWYRKQLKELKEKKEEWKTNSIKNL